MSVDPVTKFVQEWATYLGVDSTIPTIEPEPEQIYLLGSRYADYGLALAFALLLPIIRSFLNYFVFVVRTTPACNQQYSCMLVYDCCVMIHARRI